MADVLNILDTPATVAHSALTGVTADQHHAQDHASRHRSGGADELIKKVRVSTGSIAGTATAVVTVTFGVAFADANYTVPQPGVVVADTDTLTLRPHHVSVTSGASFDVVVINDGVDAETGTIHAIAVHD